MVNVAVAQLRISSNNWGAQGRGERLYVGPTANQLRVVNGPGSYQVGNLLASLTSEALFLDFKLQEEDLLAMIYRGMHFFVISQSLDLTHFSFLVSGEALKDGATQDPREAIELIESVFCINFV